MKELNQQWKLVYLCILLLLLHILEILNDKSWCPSKDNRFQFLYDIPASSSSLFILWSQTHVLTSSAVRLLVGTTPPPIRGTPFVPERGYTEVALVFVIVLQGFETFVHRSRDFATQISKCGRSFNKQASVTPSSTEAAAGSSSASSKWLLQITETELCHLLADEESCTMAALCLLFHHIGSVFLSHTS